MKFGKHPRRLPAEEWVRVRFEGVLPLDAEPADPENCPGEDVLRSYALKEKRLVLDAPTVHILKCARCTHRVAVMRRDFIAMQEKRERAKIRKFMQFTGLNFLIRVVSGLLSLIIKTGWFASRASATVSLEDETQVAVRSTPAALSVPASILSLHVHLPATGSNGIYEVGVAPHASAVTSPLATGKVVEGVSGRELNLKLDLRRLAAGEYTLFFRSDERNLSHPLRINRA